MTCKACDILPLAPKRVRLNHWRVTHQKTIGWTIVGLVLISAIIAMIIFWYKKQQAEKEKQNGTGNGTETGAEKVLGEKSMDGSSSRVGNSVTH